MANKTFSLPGEDGCKCEQCGTTLDRVRRTTRTDNFILRVRICSKCGAFNTTSERVLSSHKARRRFGKQ